jgi:hypothetical protein
VNVWLLLFAGELAMEVGAVVSSKVVVWSLLVVSALPALSVAKL